MQINRIIIFIFSTLYFFPSIINCQKQSSFGHSTFFIRICAKIDSARYEEAFDSVHLHHPRNESEQCEKDFLLARIYFAQGAFYLAENKLNSLFDRTENCSNALIEKAYLLRGDVYYQMLEFDRNYANTLELGLFWQRNFPKDALRKAMYHTLKAQYFAALIKPDSAKFHTTNALRLYRKNRVSESSLPLWMIYANHVACLRNGFSISEDLGEAKKIAYSDTCRQLLDGWFPKNNVEKSRAIQSVSMIYYDRIASYENWVLNPEQTAENFSSFLNRAEELTAYYSGIIGPRHPYNAQIQFLIGLANHYKRDTLAEYAAYAKCIRNNFSSSRSQIPFVLNWRRYFSVLRFSPFLESQLFFPKNRYSQLQSIRRGLESSEELFYLRYFYTAVLLNTPEDDIYSANPFLDIEDTDIDLYKLTGNTFYRSEAWAASQKVKYTDLLRHRYRELNAAPDKEFLKVCNQRIGEMRLLNDSILLCMHQFSRFASISVTMLENRLMERYKMLKSEVYREKLSDPLAGKFLNGKEVYTIRAVQRALRGKQAAWMDISHGGRAGTFYTMIWYITSDSVWVNLIKDGNYRNSDLIRLAECLQKNNLVDWKQLAYEVYIKSYKHDFDALKAKNITRIFYSPGQDFTSFSPEMLVTDTGNFARPRFLIEDFAFSTQLVAPTELQRHATFQHKNAGHDMFCFAPVLSHKLIDLEYSRTIATSLANRHNLNLDVDYCSAAEFISQLKKASLVQVFSHGEGEKGIWFSDRLITPAEIRSMHIQAELISLTTCESHKGEILHNEGVRGMVEAFSRAGARRIIASLWKIDEIASSRIMDYFYDELFKSAEPDVAIQRAKICFLNSAHPQELHPYFWAGMELFGEPTGRLVPQTSFKHSGFTILITLALFALVFFIMHRRFVRIRFGMHPLK